MSPSPLLLPITVRPNPVIAIAMGLFCSVMATVLLAVIYPVAFYFSPESFPKAPPYKELICNMLLFTAAFLPVTLFVCYLSGMRRRWIIQDDGITIQGWRSREFIPWSGIQDVQAALGTLSLRRIGSRQRIYLSFVPGHRFWDAIPSDKRRRFHAF